MLSKHASTMFELWPLRRRHPYTDICTFLLIKGHFWPERIPFCQLLDYFCSKGWFMFIPGSAGWGNIITANDIHKALCFSENLSKCKSTGIIHTLGTHCGFRFAYMICCRVDDNVRYWFSLLVVQAICCSCHLSPLCQAEQHYLEQCSERYGRGRFG